MYCEICEEIEKNDSKKLLKLLEYKEVNGCLLEAIKKQLDLDIIEKIYEKETNFEKCLEVFVDDYDVNKEFANKLFIKTKKFSIGCLINCSFDHELFDAVFDKISNFDFALISALYLNIVDKYILMKLAGVTTNFDECLKNALSCNKLDMEFINLLVKNTTNFKGCLKKSFESYSDEKELMNFLIINTKKYKSSLRNAIFYCPENTELVNRIYDLTKDYSRCLEMAIEKCPDNIELIDKLIDVTEDLGPALAISSKYNKEIFYKILPKIKNFKGILLNLFKNYVEDKDLLDLVVENTIDFNGCLKSSIIRKYYHEKIFNNTTNFKGCLRDCIKYWPENEELIDKLIDKTTNFYDAFRDSIRENNKASNKIFYKIEEFFDSYLCDAIKYCSNNKELIYNLIDKCESFEKPLSKAILYCPNDEELLDLLFEKNINRLKFDKDFDKLLDKKKLGDLKEKLINKYFYYSDDYDKCVNCNEFFEDEGEIVIIRCSHRVHKDCKDYNFCNLCDEEDRYYSDADDYYKDSEEEEEEDSEEDSEEE